MSGLAASLVQGRDELVALEPAWWELWRRCPETTPFQSPAWLLPWWDAFAPGQLTCVAVRDGQDLAGLAPLYVEQDSARTRLLPVGVSLSDYVDVLASPEQRPAVLKAMAGFVLAQNVPWHELDLPDVPDWGAARELRPPHGWQVTVEPGIACPVLPLSQVKDGLPSSIPSRKRRKLRMSRHRSSKQQPRIHTTGALQPKRWLDELFRLHAARWQDRGEDGVLASAAVARFQAAALPRLIAHKLARLFALELGGEIASVYLGFHSGHRAYAYLGGFDPKFAYYSPGSILLGHAIETAVDEGAREFHFLRGAEAYKYEWGATDTFNARIKFCRDVPA